jgi:hypothetical protein
MVFPATIFPKLIESLQEYQQKRNKAYLHISQNLALVYVQEPYNPYLIRKRIYLLGINNPPN